MMISRRYFVAALTAPLFVRLQGRHPEPRPGIDGRDVMTPAQLEGYGQQVREVFDMIRQIPQIADGLRCYCGCASRDGMRSLLSCFTNGGMATDCEICQGEARLAFRRFREGQTLPQIRRAIDARFG